MYRENKGHIHPEKRQAPADQTDKKPRERQSTKEIKVKIDYTDQLTNQTAPDLTVRTDGRYAKEERGILLEIFDKGILLRKYVEIDNQPRHSSLSDQFGHSGQSSSYAPDRPSLIYSSAAVVYTTVEIRKPPVDKPRKGLLSIYSNDKRVQIEAENIFSKSGIVPLELLSIIPKKAVIAIRIDMIVVNDKGGVIELLTEGIYQALNRIKIRQVMSNSMEVSKDIRNMIRFHPKTTTVAITEDNFLFDPTEEEAGEAVGSMSITHTQKEMGTEEATVINWTVAGLVKYNRLKETVEQILKIRTE